MYEMYNILFLFFISDLENPYISTFAELGHFFGIQVHHFGSAILFSVISISDS